MSSSEERAYIADKLIPELLLRFEEWGAEYKQRRELGLRGEFVGLHRKVGKLKTIVWDGVDASGWREDPRTILQEVVAHGLLMLHDMDHGDSLPDLSGQPSVSDLADGYEEIQQRKKEGISPPLDPDHFYNAALGLVVPHLAHPGVECRDWESRRQQRGEFWNGR